MPRQILLQMPAACKMFGPSQSVVRGLIAVSVAPLA